MIWTVEIYRDWLSLSVTPTATAPSRLVMEY